jgi:hypothetical protein
MLWNFASLQKEFPKIALLAVHRSSFLVRPLAPDIVLLNEDVTLQETYDGQDISGPYRWTTIWARRSGRWQLIFEQEIPIPQQTAAARN